MAANQPFEPKNFFLQINPLNPRDIFFFFFFFLINILNPRANFQDNPLNSTGSIFQIDRNPRDIFVELTSKYQGQFFQVNPLNSRVNCVTVIRKRHRLYTHLFYSGRSP